MNSHFFPGRTTPETMVGGLRKWEQIARTGGKQPMSPFSDGYETHSEVNAKQDSESEREPSPEDQYTEQHYSESEFHTEQEEDVDDNQTERDEPHRVWTGGSASRDPHIQVSQYPPKNMEKNSHLLHIDFISDELGRFGLTGSGQVKGRRQGRKVPGQQQQHNISFSRERVRQIERTNQILLRRIITTRPTLQTQSHSKMLKKTASVNCSPATSAATNRRRMQEKIAAENEFLLQKVNSAESRLTKRMTR